MHAEPGADLLDRRVVALVQEPDVHQAAVADSDGRLQGLRHHLQRFLAGDEGGEEGDLGAGLRHHRDRVPGDEGGMRVRQDVQRAEQLDQTDRDQHDDVEDQQQVVVEVRIAVRPVAGLHQPGEEPERDERSPAEQERRAHPVRFLGYQRAVAHLVRLARGGCVSGPASRL